MERRIGVSAGLSGFAIGIVLAIFEVQQWNMPAPLAVVFIVLMSLLAIVAFGVIIYEVGKAAWRIWQQRTVEAAWVSAEEPGLLDFEANLLKASNRFAVELNKLTKDTQRLGNQLPKHQKRIQNAANSSNPYKKQNIANQAAKDIGKSAVFIGRRRKLLDLLVNEINRNGQGILSTINLNQTENIESGLTLQKELDINLDTTRTTIDSISTYRDTAKGLAELNLSRTIRIESNRLMEALDSLLKTIRRYNTNSQQLKNTLARKMSSSH